MDILGEARKALAWITADPRRRKTAGGMKKFLVHWFGNGTQRGTYAHRLPDIRRTAGSPGTDYGPGAFDPERGIVS